MPNVLRRKMFKLGGEVSKSHGVGLTHGLNYNKGGKVVAGVGSGMNPKVEGPDGMMREAHAVGTIANLLRAAAPYGAMGLKSLSGAGKAARQGLGSLKNFFNPRTKPTSVSYGIPNSFVRSDPIKSKRFLGSMRPSTYISPDRLTQAARIGGTGLGLGAGAGLASAPFARNEDPTSGAGRLLENVRGLGEGALDLSTALPVQVPQMIGNFFSDDENQGDVKGTSQLIKEIFQGETEEKKEKPQQTIKQESQNMKTMKSEAEAKMKEYYELLGGGKDASLSDWSRVFVAASKASQESGDDPLAMITAGAEEAINIGAEDKELAQQAAVMGLQDVQQRQLMKEDTLNKIMISGGVDSLVEAERVYEAAEQAGDMSAIVRLPMKGTEEDDTQTLPNTVYTDIAGISGKLFVAYDSDMNPKITNNYQEALNHAEG